MLSDDLINKVVAIEGGYTNDPDDPGGETIFGITIAVARAYGYAGPMKSMTRDTAIAIYRARYWVQPRFDQIASVDTHLAAQLFDIGVNMGPTVGVTFMQRCLNVLNNQESLFPDVATDGGIGPLTIAALHTFWGSKGTAGLAILNEMVTALRAVKYIELAEAKKTNEKFEYGWQTRAFST